MALSPGTCTPALPGRSHSGIVCNKRLKCGQYCQQSNLLFKNLYATATSKLVKEQIDSAVSISQQLQHLAFDRTSQVALKTLRYSYLCRKDEYEADKQAKRTKQSGNWHQQVVSVANNDRDSVGCREEDATFLRCLSGDFGVLLL